MAGYGKTGETGPRAQRFPHAVGNRWPSDVTVFICLAARWARARLMIPTGHDDGRSPVRWSPGGMTKVLSKERPVDPGVACPGKRTGPLSAHRLVRESLKAGQGERSDHGSFGSVRHDIWA